MKKIKVKVVVALLSLTLGFCSPVMVANPVQSSVSVVQPEVQAKAKTVYITETGSCYHKRKCGNGTYYKVRLSEAKEMGLRKCKKCYGK
ncbi:MAG: hypothetical protein E7280_04960 [Lachnospiraceae bacterium]|nr:hypothetical protein [Lachnospiraceae bacterium]